jgi:hypothetical protein
MCIQGGSAKGGMLFDVSKAYIRFSFSRWYSVDVELSRHSTFFFLFLSHFNLNFYFSIFVSCDCSTDTVDLWIYILTENIKKKVERPAPLLNHESATRPSAAQRPVGGWGQAAVIRRRRRAGSTQPCGASAS